MYSEALLVFAVSVLGVSLALARNHDSAEVQKHENIQAIADTHGGAFLSTERFLSIVIDGLAE